jgi:hypothetical protein
MKLFDVRSIQLEAPFERAFAFIAGQDNLPRWTSAFKRVGGGRALLETAAGSVEVGLQVDASREYGVVDWHLSFPDGGRASAHSRLIDLGSGRLAYTFVLTPPPVALEQIEGALEQQSQRLGEELQRLRDVLEAR